MTTVIKHYCDAPGCGKEFSKAYYPPRYPDYCPEHMKEYQDRLNAFSTYAAPKDLDIQAWFKNAEAKGGTMVIGGSSNCHNCGRTHPPGPCENFVGSPRWID